MTQNLPSKQNGAAPLVKDNPLGALLAQNKKAIESLLPKHMTPERMTDHPPIPCPDCDGLMHLSEKPLTWQGGSPVVYLCENRKLGCRGLMGAHPDGRPLGIPANAETRRARTIVHNQAFDRLWKDAPAMYPEGDPGRPTDAALRRIAKVRAYKWLSEMTSIPLEKCHMSMMDLDQLRLVWRTIKEHQPTMESIRQWAQGRKKKQ